MKQPYNYAIIRHNYPEIAQINTLIECIHRPKAMYAMLVKTCHKDGSESILFIEYSNDLEHLHVMANKYPSWYNYPIGVYKAMQGSLHETSC